MGRKRHGTPPEDSVFFVYLPDLNVPENHANFPQSYRSFNGVWTKLWENLAATIMASIEKVTSSP